MTMIVMLHGARQLPTVWRNVSDCLHPDWGVVAPQLHGLAGKTAMENAIVTDLEHVCVRPPIYVVAAGEGLIPAARFCAHNADTGDIGGLLVAEPQFAVSRTVVRMAKIKAAVLGNSRKPEGKRAAVTDATNAQRYAYMASLVGESALHNLKSLEKASIPIRVLSGEKNRAGCAAGQNLMQHLKQAEFFTIARAEWDWNAYAPANFAANIMEFVEHVHETHKNSDSSSLC